MKLSSVQFNHALPFFKEISRAKRQNTKQKLLKFQYVNNSPFAYKPKYLQYGNEYGGLCNILCPLGGFKMYCKSMGPRCLCFVDAQTILFILII